MADRAAPTLLARGETVTAKAGSAPRSGRGAGGVQARGDEMPVKGVSATVARAGGAAHRIGPRARAGLAVPAGGSTPAARRATKPVMGTVSSSRNRDPWPKDSARAGGWALASTRPLVQSVSSKSVRKREPAACRGAHEESARRSDVVWALLALIRVLILGKPRRRGTHSPTDAERRTQIFLADLKPRKGRRSTRG